MQEAAHQWLCEPCKRGNHTWCTMLPVCQCPNVWDGEGYRENLRRLQRNKAVEKLQRGPVDKSKGIPVPGPLRASTRRPTMCAPRSTPPSAPPGLDFLPFVLIAAFAYFLLLRPSMRQEKERKALRSSLKKDDKVLLTSGIYGVVASVSDKEDEVVVRVPPDNVRLKIVKAAIDRNLTNEEAAREAKGGKAPATSTTTTNLNQK